MGAVFHRYATAETCRILRISLSYLFLAGNIFFEQHTSNVEHQENRSGQRRVATRMHTRT